MNRVIRLIIMLPLLGLVPLLAATAAAPLPMRRIDLRPHWNERIPLVDPHKGWYHHYPDNHINKSVHSQSTGLMCCWCVSARGIASADETGEARGNVYSQHHSPPDDFHDEEAQASD